MSEYTADADGMGVLRLLNAIRSAGLAKKTRVYQARRQKRKKRHLPTPHLGDVIRSGEAPEIEERLRRSDSNR